MKNGILICTLVFWLIACVSAPAAKEQRGVSGSTNSYIQYFYGKIQRSSVDETRMYGPEFDSLVRRYVDREQGIVQECVFQEGKAFLTTLTTTESPLKFAVQDAGGFSKGFLLFSDETLMAWSYDIDVIRPTVGKITGSLSEKMGARISPDGKMEIRKLWNQQVLLHESYNGVTETQYRKQLRTIFASEVPQECL